LIDKSNKMHIMKHYKTKQQVYTDLEFQSMQAKNNKFIVHDVKQLIKNYPNDTELGNVIRKYFIKNNHDADNRI
jgi:hypothetical protein